MFHNRKIFILYMFLNSILIVLGLDEDSYKEKHCIQPPPKVDETLDVQWVQSVKNWYSLYGRFTCIINDKVFNRKLFGQLSVYSFKGKEGFYRATQELEHDARKLKNVTEDQVIKAGCFKASVSDTQGKASFTGLGGKTEEFKVSYPSKGTYIYEPVLQDGSTGGYAEITLTDNKNFIFLAECWDGDQEAWQVESPFKSVDKATEDKIYAHAKSLGFNEKYFEKQDYSHCDDVESASLSSSEEEEEHLSDSFSDESGENFAPN